MTGLALRRPLAVLVCALVVVVTGLALASQLSLQTDLAELLPPHAPSVIALRRLSERVGGTGNVAIAIESIDGKPDALRAYVPILADRLRRELGSALLSLRYRRTEVEDYYRKFAAYYVSLDELERWSARVHRAVASRENPLYVELDDTDELHLLAAEVREARDRLKPANAADAATGLYMTEQGRLAVVFVRPAADSLNLAGSADLIHRIEAIVEATDPTAHGARIAGYTGSIPTALTEVDAVRRDIVGSALLVIFAVGGVVVMYFRGVRELFVLAAPLVVGVAAALGFAECAFGHLNAQTAFLGSIIVGTGINYGIIFLDRFRRESVDGTTLEQALRAASAATLRATAIAAIATAASFGVLAAGEVESFRQFGWIGGLGILVCWIATFTIVPALLVVTHHRHLNQRRERRLAPLVAACRWLGRASERAPWLVIGTIIALATAGATVAIHARDHAVETDMRKLATRSSDTSGIEKLDNRLRAMDDRSSTPAVIATARREDTGAVCELLNARARTDLRGILVGCHSIDELFPVELERRRSAIVALRDELAMIELADVEAADRGDLAELQRTLAAPAPADRDLPLALKEYFIERDGSLGKLAYVDPVDENIEDNLYRFTDAIRSIQLPTGKLVESSGDLVVFADVLRAVRRDARKLTIAAALLVVLVLVLVTRRFGTSARVAGALVAGIAVMLGAAVVLDQKLNFFNFVALPTTFGIAIDYAVNIEERMRQRGAATVATALTEAGPAVLLASMTSMLGYASLLTADSRALSSFGALAILGELACVLVAVTLVPALWAAQRSRRVPRAVGR